MKPVLVVRHVPHEGLGAIAPALERAGIPYSICDTLAPGTSLPPFDPDHHSGLIVMGGPMNVDEVDKHPPLVEEVKWIQQAVAAQLPVLGVCLGCQLLAKALGSRVFANRVKEIGWYDVELLPAAGDDLLFGQVCNSQGAAAKPQAAGIKKIHIFQWHGDTFDLPAGAVQLARSPQCEQQAFRYGPSAYGLQFHMEVTAEIVDSWLCEDGNCGELAGLDYIDPAAIRQQTPRQLPAMIEAGNGVFDRFAKLCEERK